MLFGTTPKRHLRQAEKEQLPLFVNDDLVCINSWQRDLLAQCGRVGIQTKTRPINGNRVVLQHTHIENIRVKPHEYNIIVLAIRGKTYIGLAISL